MATVELLDDALVDKIAAGEVVERPASVVKELVENALDAGAKAISVTIANGGKDRIQVVDDGHGMSREDATLAIKRHATSKLRRFEDLLALGTLGFRGEALPSIASVSRFELTTRRREDVAGTRVRIEGGSPPEVRDAGCPPGSTLTIDELFYNVPARRKFLRARQTERLHVVKVVLEAAMANPEVRFVLTHDGRVLRELLPAPSRYARARAIFDDEPLRPIGGEHDGIRVEGGLGSPGKAKRGTKQLHLFVNGRPVEDHALARAIAFAHGDALPKGRYPSGAVFVELDPEQVDVNAHPQKSEVRFADLRRVTDAVTRILTDALGTRRWEDDEGRSVRGSAARATTAEPSSGPLLEPPAGGPLARKGSFWQERLRPGPTVPRTSTPAVVPSPRPPESRAESAFASALRERPQPTPVEAPLEPPPIRPLGSLSNGLVVGEHDGALHAVEPHALFEAHARAVLGEDPVPRRRLLFPARITAPTTDSVALEALDALGFDLRPIGERALAVHAVPRFDGALEAPGEAIAIAALADPEPRAIARTFAAEVTSTPDADTVWRLFLALEPDARRRVATAIALTDLTRAR